MFVKQVKRKCSVRGCKSTECFAISRTREVGNTVIICRSCLSEALGDIDKIDPKTKSNIPTLDNTTAPPLFFNAKALGTETDIAAVDKNKEPETGLDVSPDDVADFKCNICGKSFDSEKGLKTHLRYCKPHDDVEKGAETE